MPFIERNNRNINVTYKDGYVIFNTKNNSYYCDNKMWSKDLYKAKIYKHSKYVGDALFGLYRGDYNHNDLIFEHILVTSKEDLKSNMIISSEIKIVDWVYEK